MPVRVKVLAYQLPYADWARMGQKPPEDLAPLRPYWLKIVPEDNEKLVSEVIMDSIQDVYDIIDEEGQRIHIYHMSIDGAMVQLLEKCDVMCQADELKVYFEIVNY